MHGPLNVKYGVDALEKGKYLWRLPGIETQFLRLSAHSLVTMPTALQRMRHNGVPEYFLS